MKNPAVPNYRLRMEYHGRESSILYANEIEDITAYFRKNAPGCKGWSIYSSVTETYYFPIGKDVVSVPKEIVPSETDSSG